jgi:hypothetical protein
LQYELLLAADGERTPATLARILGRAGFVTLQQVRALAAAGLIVVTPEERAGEPAGSGDPEAPDLAVDGGVVDGGPAGGSALRAAVPAPGATQARTAKAAVDPPATSVEVPGKVTATALPVRAAGPDETMVITAAKRDEPEPARPTRKTTGGRRRAGNRAGAAILTENMPRRVPGEQMPAGAGDVQTVPDGGPLHADAPDEALLTRIRSALKALR